MSAFNYSGMARIQWGQGLADSEHFISWADNVLMVDPLTSPPNSAPHPPEAWCDYVGPMVDHPSVHIVFLHR